MIPQAFPQAGRTKAYPFLRRGLVKCVAGRPSALETTLSTQNLVRIGGQRHWAEAVGVPDSAGTDCRSVPNSARNGFGGRQDDIEPVSAAYPILRNWRCGTTSTRPYLFLRANRGQQITGAYPFLRTASVWVDGQPAYTRTYT